ncbi:hypothetical protein [Mucilaginibacter sp. PPCGB 2223]|uniref:tetratricopeptide repeat protein n=1 Tax=Mucilaginibacter sp. PPCGB 2223 TaxID=1886027 RepID=UPI001111EA5D|nr:hypothetical protein [Mucilaginibacter sp. PPCGB 2223]
MSLPNAMAALNGLTDIARNIGDQPLECSVYEMRADYYSVNYGFSSMGVYYYDQAVNYARQRQLKLEEGIYIHKKAQYYALFKHNTAACQYFLDAQDIFNTLGVNRVPDITIYLWDFAAFYYNIGAYEDCKVYLTQALRYDIPRLRNRINITNTIGLIYRNYGQYQPALTTFKKVLNIATAGKDTAWIGIANGNIGSVYFMQKQYAIALPYIESDYRLSLKYHENLNAAIALLRLARISVETGKTSEARQQLTQIGTMLRMEKTNVLKYQTELYRLEAEYDEHIGNLRQALMFRQKYEAAKDSLIDQDNVAAVDRVGLQWEKDKHLIQIDELKSNSRIATIRMTFIIALLFLILVAFIITYSRRIIQVKKDKDVLITQKSNVDEDLRNATAALAIYTKSLKNKNDVIEQFRKRIEEMQSQTYDEMEIEKLSNLVQTHIMTDETWNEFKKLFGKVHTSFFSNLTNNYPHISTADIRLLALIKMGLNNREMANMLGITVEGIKKAKQRLRKKMGLKPNQDIETVILDF